MRAPAREAGLPPRTGRPEARGRSKRPAQAECGQASVELVALVPLLLAVGLAAAQLLAVGYSHVLAGNAAEAGALAVAGGGDAQAAVRHALPGWSRARVSVRGGEVTVEFRPPTLLRALTGELRVRAEAAVEAP
jgi:hypothetical protein